MLWLNLYNTETTNLALQQSPLQEGKFWGILRPNEKLTVVYSLANYRGNDSTAIKLI